MAAAVNVPDGFCPYCGQIRVLTDEHVLPSAIGGNVRGTPSANGIVSGNPFKLKVCGRCNSTCGTWVDGMFTRSWLLHSARFMASRHHIDLEHGIAPLLFMGRTEFVAPGLECDLWLGPTGDAVYHLHEPYPRDHPTVGIPHWVDRTTLDRGVACVYVRASNPQWHPVIGRSIADAFKGAPIVWRNATVIDARTGELRTSTVPAKYASLAETIHQAVFVERQTAHRVGYQQDTACGHRFLVKLGLGFGALFLDPSYATSADASTMRSLLWARETESWPDGTTGTPFFSPIDEPFDHLTDWRGCHMLMLLQHDRGIGLGVKLYGRYDAALTIASSDFGFFDRFAAPEAMWIVAPGLRLFAGPMSLEEYTVARLQPNPCDRLALLRDALDSTSVLPPFDLPQRGNAG